ncbi:MAG TPA: hypothetical protein VF190_03105 [Rhodothermales bacterium]
MPAVSTLLVRLAFAYLLAGSTIGAALLIGKALTIWPWLWSLRPLHIEFLLFGWMVQLAFGVGSWILPRTAERYDLRPLVGALVLVNLGVWLSGVAAAQAWHAALLAGRILEMAAMAAFGWHIWPRIRPFRG